jgi:putative transposase
VPPIIWTADFKGQFKTLDGKYCYPLTVVDGYSRFLLGCQALEAPQSKLSRLSVWWIRLGIFPELIQPAKPQQNGRHERMHRTLKQEATIPLAASRCGQQHRFNRFRHEYNHERSHEALDQNTPAENYQRSPRPLPKKLPPLHYPDHWEVRLVSNNGGVRWKVERILVSFTLRKQYVGFEPLDDGIWEVWFGPLKLGRFDERHGKIIDALGKKAPRKV